MPKRTKIILIISIIVFFLVVFGLYSYYKNKKFKADTINTQSSLIGYFGTVVWSDKSPASGILLSLANRQVSVDKTGTYRTYLSSDDFDSGIVDARMGAEITFYNPITLREYGQSDQLEKTTLPKPIGLGSDYIRMDIVLNKPSFPANNFALAGIPSIAARAATFSTTFVNPTRVTLTIADSTNQTVRTVTKDVAKGTTGAIVWDGKKDDGANAPDSAYKITLSGDDFVNATTKLTTNTFTLKSDLLSYLLIGDTNKSGQIDAADATKVLRVVTGLDTAPSNICQYDVNKNGKIDSGDATKIQRMAVGLDKINFETCTP